MEESLILTTTFYNANFAFLNRIAVPFVNFGGQWRADPQGNYTAGTVRVGLNQQLTDHAVSFAESQSGQGEVDLTYKGTGIRTNLPSSVEEGQVFNLQVAPQGDILVEPIVYQWFKEGQALGDPTTSQTLSTQIFGSGMTVVFLVEATDAIGQVTQATGRVNVPANCGNPPCPEQ